MLSKRLFRTVVCLMMALCVCFGFYCPAPSVEAKTVSELKNEQAELESKANEIKDRINALKQDKNEKQQLKNALDDKIYNLEQQIANCQAKLDALNSEISTHNKEIESLNSQLEENKDLFKKRLRAIHMSGGESSIMMILGSGSIADYLSMSELTKSLSDYDNAVFNSISESITEINKKIESIDALKAEQDAIKADLSAKQRELQGDVSQVNSVIADIDSSTKDLQAELRKEEAAMRLVEEAIRAAQNSGTGNSTVVTSSEMAWPVPGFHNITSPWGWRFDPYYRVNRMHKGIDIAQAGISGKPIVAAMDGTVVIAQYNNGGYGNYVTINHGMKDGKMLSTAYAHMSSYIVSAGQRVSKGQTIGYVGTTGASTGYHLHFEVWVGGATVNPMSYFR